MLVKKPRKSGLFVKLIKGAFVAEVAFFFGSYTVYHYLNTSYDSRYFAYQRAPFVLNWFYNFIEFCDSSNKQREKDLALWRQEGKIE